MKNDLNNIFGKLLNYQIMIEIRQNKWSQIDSNQPTWHQTKIFQKS